MVLGNDIKKQIQDLETQRIELLNKKNSCRKNTLTHVILASMITVSSGIYGIVNLVNNRIAYDWENPNRILTQKNFSYTNSNLSNSSFDFNINWDILLPFLVSGLGIVYAIGKVKTCQEKRVSCQEIEIYKLLIKAKKSSNSNIINSSEYKLRFAPQNYSSNSNLKPSQNSIQNSNKN